MKLLEKSFSGALNFLADFSRKNGVSIPIDFNEHLSYHLGNRSFDQEKYERDGVTVVDCARSELTAQAMEKLPYSGSKVIVLFVHDKNYWHRADFQPIEIQFPKRIGWGDPLKKENWLVLRSEYVARGLQKKIDAAGLPFQVEIIQSMLPGKMGMDYVMLKLNYHDGAQSFSDYLLKGPNPPAEEYSRIIHKLRIILSEIVASDFKGMYDESSYMKWALPTIMRKIPREEIDALLRKKPLLP
jgi:hypothetical protein